MEKIGVCPNCGGLLRDFRTDRQDTGAREIVLVWLICRSCRHVALKDWWFESETTTRSSRPTRRHFNSGEDV